MTSSPLAFPLSAQQVRELSGGLDRVVRLTVTLPGVSPDDASVRLAAAVARHEVLRSTLRRESAVRTGLQLVHGDGRAEWTVLARGPEADAAARGIAHRIDPTDGPVLAGVLTRDDADGTELTLCVSSLFGDLATLGALAAEAAGAAVVPDPIQYAEYAAWQAEVLDDTSTEDRASAAAAWAVLADEDVRTTTLPAVAGSASAPGPQAATRVDSPTEAGDPVALWLARWAVTISRLTGDSAVALAVEIDPTDDPELEGAVGPYARLVPLTVQVPARGTLSTLADELAQSLVVARTWHEWAPAPSAVSLVFSVGPLASHVDRDDFQVELRVAPDGRQAAVLAGAVVGSEAVATHAARALRMVLASESDAVEELDVLDRTTQDALLGPPATTAASLPLAARIAGHAATVPERVALTDGATSLTYAQLLARVEGLAAALVDAAEGSTAPVAVYLPRSVDAIVAMLAAQLTGFGHVVLDVDGPDERAALQASIAGASLLVSRGSAPLGFEGRRVPLESHGRSPRRDATPDDLAYVMFTSGSTGRPKGVSVGADNLAGYVAAVLDVVEAAVGGTVGDPREPGDLTWALVTGLTTDLGHTCVFGALASGGTLHVVPSDLVQDPQALSAHFAAHPVDVLKITPSHLRALLADADADVLPRRVLVLGGEVSTWELVQSVRARSSCRVVNHYGPTECTVGALTYSVPLDVDGLGGALPIGVPLTGYEAVVVDARLRLVPVGASGELLVAGVGVSRGYVADPTATAPAPESAFVEHPYRPGVRAYRTGDLVRRDEDGTVWFLGRRDDQVKVRGFRVEPHEIELALAQHPAVSRAAVVLRHDLGAEPTLVGYVVTQLNPAPTEDELREHLSSRLPQHMVPSRLVDLDSLPLRANGKLDAAALPVPPPPSGPSLEPPTGETETALAQIFRDALGVADVAAHDDFFALGGHSLLATRVVVEVRERLGVQLPVHTLFDAPTVRLLADQVEIARGGLPADELAALIAEISSMSDDEATRRLAAEAGQTDPGGWASP